VVKFIFSIFLIATINLNLRAQTDSLTMFHEPMNLAGKARKDAYKNTVNFNLFQIVRGSALLSYERMVGNYGLSLTAGIGICKFDALGQVYLRELTQYYMSGSDVTKVGTKIKPLYEVGVKYYTDQSMGGTYFMAAFTSINNTVNLKPFSGNTSTYVPPNFNQLDYRSNEFKLLLGFSNKNDKKFYHDINAGLGYRFIAYQNFQLKDITAQNSNGQYLYELFKYSNTNQTIWIFVAWRMGLRF
jgi:hypothetical protein